MLVECESAADVCWTPWHQPADTPDCLACLILCAATRRGCWTHAVSLSTRYLRPWLQQQCVLPAHCHWCGKDTPVLLAWVYAPKFPLVSRVLCLKTGSPLFLNIFFPENEHTLINGFGSSLSHGDMVINKQSHSLVMSSSLILVLLSGFVEIVCLQSYFANRRTAVKTRHLPMCHGDNKTKNMIAHEWQLTMYQLYHVASVTTRVLSVSPTFKLHILLTFQCFDVGWASGRSSSL